MLGGSTHAPSPAGLLGMALRGPYAVSRFCCFSTIFRLFRLGIVRGIPRDDFRSFYDLFTAV